MSSTTMPRPPPSHGDVLSPASSGRQWTLKSMARKALRLSHFRSQDTEPAVASPSILLPNTGSHPHGRKLTRTLKPDRKLPTTFDLQPQAHVYSLTSEPSSPPPSSPTPLSLSITSPLLPSRQSVPSHARPISPPLYPLASSHPPPPPHPPLALHPPPPANSLFLSNPVASSNPPAAPSLLSSPLLLAMSEDPEASSEEELTLKRLESQRAAILVEKQAAEALMHDNANKVHMYQKEFEVYQRAFITAVTRLHELDLQLSDIRNEKDTGVGEGGNVDTGDSHRTVGNLGLYWHGPVASDSDSDIESVY